MLVFGKALGEYEGALGADEIVLVQGPRRPQGSGQHVPGRAERRSASRRPSEEIERPAPRPTRPRAPARRRPRAGAPARRRARRPAGERDRRAQARARGLPRARPRWPDRDRTPADGRAGAAPRRRLPGGAHADAARRARTASSAPRRAAPAGCPPQPRGLACSAARAARAASPRSRRRPRARSSSRSGPSRFSPGRLQHARQALDAAARTGTPRSPSSPSSPVADIGVAVAVGAERRLRVVEVQRADAAARRARVARSRMTASRARGRADVVAGGEQVAGVQAHAEALAAAGRLDQRGELLEGAAERAAGAGGVLQVQLGSPRCRRAPRRSSCRRARSPRRRRPVLAEPGCSTTPAAPIAVADAQRVASARPAIWRGSRRPRWRS